MTTPRSCREAGPRLRDSSGLVHRAIPALNAWCCDSGLSYAAMKDVANEDVMLTCLRCITHPYGGH